MRLVVALTDRAERGRRPECQPGAFSFGEYLTVFCWDEAPFVDRPRLAGSVKGDVPTDAVFGSDPYLAACDARDVPAASAAVQEPITTAIPTLVLVGQFDSFSPVGIAREALGPFSSGYLVEVPGQTHQRARVRRVRGDDPECMDRPSVLCTLRNRLPARRNGRVLDRDSVGDRPPRGGVDPTSCESNGFPRVAPAQYPPTGSERAAP